jgi:hypothetical protein
MLYRLGDVPFSPKSMSSVPPSSTPPRANLTAWIAITGVVALLPLLTFSLLAGRELVKQQQSVERTEIERRAEVAAREIAREVRVMFAALDTLAASDVAQRADYEALYAYAVRIARSLPRIGSISAVDAEGKRRFSTLVPYTAPLPPTDPGDADTQVLVKGVANISPLIVGALSGRQLVTLSVPVKAQDKAVMVLSLTVWSESIEEVIHEQQWPATWTAAVIDQNMAIVARSRTPKRFVGQPASAEIQDAIRKGIKGAFASITKDQMAVTASVMPIAGTQWHMAVGAPAQSLAANVRNALDSVLWIGLLCAALAIVGVWYQTKSLRRHLAQWRDSVNPNAAKAANATNELNDANEPNQPNRITLVDGASGGLLPDDKKIDRKPDQ